ncbi:MAG: hypothetical protein HKN13_04295, partial [Rhodothermales bacterium]|nr:hypothetical protein [Rhodothermales bacterium]
MSTLICMVLLCTVAGCTSSAVVPAQDRVDERKSELVDMVSGSDSTDFEVLRELGYIHLKELNFVDAGPLLARAYALNPADPLSRHLYGLYLENEGHIGEAISMYEGYRELPQARRYRGLRELMAGRYTALRSEQLRLELIALSDSISALGDDFVQTDSPPNTVAVFPISFDGGDDRFAPLGRGLSALIMTDLGHVREIQVLERLRLQVLMAELNLSESDAIEPSTAPLVGNLLRARRVVGGHLTVDADERVAIRLGIRNTATDELDRLDASDRLSEFYALEKDIV